MLQRWFGEIGSTGGAPEDQRSPNAMPSSVSGVHPSVLRAISDFGNAAVWGRYAVLWSPLRVQSGTSQVELVTQGARKAEAAGLRGGVSPPVHSYEFAGGP